MSLPEIYSLGMTVFCLKFVVGLTASITGLLKSITKYEINDKDVPDTSLDLMSQSVSITPGSDTSLASMLSEYLAQHRHDNIAALDPVVVQYLAHRQLQTLMGRG